MTNMQRNIDSSSFKAAKLFNSALSNRGIGQIICDITDRKKKKNLRNGTQGHLALMAG